MTSQQRFWNWFAEKENKLFDFEMNREAVYDKLGEQLQKVDPDMLRMDEKKISTFWRWFLSFANNLRPEVLTGSSIAELESQLAKLGGFDWEIGPGLDRENMLAISPRQDLSLLEATRGIVKKAPPLRDWEFHHAKPPRQWKLRFELENGQIVDGTKWESLILQFRDLTSEILLRPNDDCGLDIEHQEIAASILVEGELGEEKLMERVKRIEIVKGWTEGQRGAVHLLELGLLGRAVS